MKPIHDTNHTTNEERFELGYITVERKLIVLEDISHLEVLILSLFIGFYKHNNSGISASNAYLQKYFNISERSIQSSLKKLKDLGYIDVISAKIFKDEGVLTHRRIYLTNKMIDLTNIQRITETQRTALDTQETAGVAQNLAEATQRTAGIYKRYIKDKLKDNINTLSDVSRETHEHKLLSGNWDTVEKKGYGVTKDEVIFKKHPDVLSTQPIQDTRLTLTNSTETNLKALNPDSIPDVLNGCNYFKISPNEMKLVKAHFEKQSLPKTYWKMAILEVDEWLTKGEKGSQAYKARKNKTHFRHCYAVWVLRNIDQRYKILLSKQRDGKLEVQAKIYQEAVELGIKPSGTTLTFSQQEELEKKRAVQEFLNDKKDIAK